LMLAGISIAASGHRRRELRSPGPRTPRAKRPSLR
jgi:hypothetical protein